MDCKCDAKLIFVDVTYCDDVFIFGSSANATDCIANLHRVTNAVSHVFKTHGMNLNFKLGNSEAIVMIKNRGFVNVRMTIKLN